MLWLVASACSADHTSVTAYEDFDSVEPTVRVVGGVPAPADAPPKETSVPVRGYILAAEAVGAVAYIGTSAGAYRLTGQGIALLDSRRTGNESVVAVRTMARLNEAVVAATDSGLMVAGEDTLTALVAGPELDDLEISAIAATETDVWVGTRWSAAPASHRRTPTSLAARSAR